MGNLALACTSCKCPEQPAVHSSTMDIDFVVRPRLNSQLPYEYERLEVRKHTQLLKRRSLSGRAEETVSVQVCHSQKQSESVNNVPALTMASRQEGYLEREQGENEEENEYPRNQEDEDGQQQQSIRRLERSRNVTGEVHNVALTIDLGWVAHTRTIHFLYSSEVDIWKIYQSVPSSPGCLRVRRTSNCLPDFKVQLLFAPIPPTPSPTSSFAISLARYDPTVGSDFIIGIVDHSEACKRLFCEGAPYLQYHSFEKYRLAGEAAEVEPSANLFRVEISWERGRVCFYRNGEVVKEEELKEGLRGCQLAVYVQTRKRGQELEWKMRDGMSTIIQESSFISN